MASRTPAIISIVAVVLSAAAVAQEQNTVQLGSFLITTQKDPLSGKDTVVASIASGTGVVGFKCSNGALSLVVSDQDHKFTEGDKFDVNVRVDNRDTIDEIGIAISGTQIEVQNNAARIMNQTRAGHIISVGIDGGASLFTITAAFWQPDKAISMVRKACGPPPAK